jgi:hypothetical protein
MEAIGFLDPVRSAPAASRDTRRIGSAVSRGADQVDSNFSATLLAMAGHDLRQPLQLITSARDVLAQTLGSGHFGAGQSVLPRAGYCSRINRRF